MAYSLEALDRQLRNARTSLKNVQDNLKNLRSSLDKAKRGSAQYQSLVDQISAASEREKKQLDQIKVIESSITEAKKSPFTKENVAQKKKLEENLARAKDKQDQAAIQKAQELLNTFVGGLTPTEPVLTTPAKQEQKPDVLKPRVQTPPRVETATSGAGMKEAIDQFNVGRTPAVPGATPSGLPTGASIDEIFRTAATLYGGIDEIFKTNEELKALLTKAVGDPKNPKDDYTETQFLNELENTKWFKTNAGPIRQRGFYERQYNELVKGLKTDDPDYKAKIAELNKTSEWGRGLASAEESVREYVTKYLGINALDDTTIKSIASELYRYANEDDAVKIRNAVLSAAKYGKGGPIGGTAGESLTSLKAIAAANGFDLEKSFGTSIPTWIDNINKGESIETYKKIIRDAAKTAFNVNDRISALLDQGVDLSTIYKPYTNVMASVLEINPSEITLDDLSKKGVIGNKDQMNLYDFQRVLRKDPRWQYTQGARQEVSDSALNVLRDFGFQG